MGKCTLICVNLIYIDYMLQITLSASGYLADCAGKNIKENWQHCSAPTLSPKNAQMTGLFLENTLRLKLIGR